MLSAATESKMRVGFDVSIIAGHVSGSTGGVQAILPLANRVAHGKKTHRHVRDYLRHLSLG